MGCLIVDDSPDFVDAARGLLKRRGMVVVGVASSGTEALSRFAELRPDVPLVDIDLGAESGFDVIEKLHRAGAPSPSPRFLAKSALSADAVRDLVRGSAGLQEGDHR